MFRIRLRELREAAGFKSQKAFAEAFGVAQTTVAGWEGGKREPNYETTMRLADFFNVSLDYLLGISEQNSSGGEENKIEELNLQIPDDIKYLAFAFHRGGVDELTQGDIDQLVEIAKILKKEGRKRKE